MAPDIIVVWEYFLKLLLLIESNKTNPLFYLTSQIVEDNFALVWCSLIQCQGQSYISIIYYF